MPRWLEIVFTLVLFTAAMSVVGMAINAYVPSVHAWLIERVGRAGVWAILIGISIVAGAIAYRGHRKSEGTNPNGT